MLQAAFAMIIIIITAQGISEDGGITSHTANFLIVNGVFCLLYSSFLVLFTIRMKKVNPSPSHLLVVDGILTIFCFSGGIAGLTNDGIRNQKSINSKGETDHGLVQGGSSLTLILSFMYAMSAWYSFEQYQKTHKHSVQGEQNEDPVPYVREHDATNPDARSKYDPRRSTGSRCYIFVSSLLIAIMGIIGMVEVSNEVNFYSHTTRMN